MNIEDTFTDDVFGRRLARLAREKQIAQLHKDRQVLQTLDFTPAQIATYQNRIADIEWRLKWKRLDYRLKP